MNLPDLSITTSIIYYNQYEIPIIALMLNTVKMYCSHTLRLTRSLED